jgi:hypothetical protein
MELEPVVGAVTSRICADNGCCGDGSGGGGCSMDDDDDDDEADADDDAAEV